VPSIIFRPFSSKTRVPEAHRALEELLLREGVGDAGRRSAHHVAVELLVELADAVARHRRPASVEGAHRVAVGALRVEQAGAAPLERVAEVHRDRDELDRLAAFSPDLAEREADGHHLERGLAGFAEAILGDRSRPLEELAIRFVDLVLLERGRAAKAARLDRFEDGEVAPADDRPGPRQARPPLEAGEHPEPPERRRARHGVGRETLSSSS